MNFTLFGFMGVGKTAVGKAMANKTGLAYVDLDEEITRRSGKTIPQIFDREGEAAFRDIERLVTRDISERDGQVIACGGGTVLDGENLTNLKRSSLMILLTAEPEVILQRIQAEGDARPLLREKNKLERIRSLLSSRHQKYICAADLIVETSNRTPEQIAHEILDKIKGVQSR